MPNTLSCKNRLSLWIRIFTRNCRSCDVLQEGLLDQTSDHFPVMAIRLWVVIKGIIGLIVIACLGWLLYRNNHLFYEANCLK